MKTATKKVITRFEIKPSQEIGESDIYVINVIRDYDSNTKHTYKRSTESKVAEIPWDCTVYPFPKIMNDYTIENHFYLYPTFALNRK